MSTMKSCLFGLSAALLASSAELRAQEFHMVAFYEVTSPVPGARQQLEVWSDGDAVVTTTLGGTQDRVEAELDPAETAGLEAALADLVTSGPRSQGPGGGPTIGANAGAGSRGTITKKVRFAAGGTNHILAIGQDVRTRAITQWLDDLIDFTVKGLLDTENMLLHAKLQRPDIGGLATSILIANRANEEIRFEIDADGRRTLESRRPLVDEEIDGVAAMLALVDPLPEGDETCEDHWRADLYVLTFFSLDDPWSVREVCPLYANVPGLPAMDILLYMLDD